jgi:hypothetical protein
MCPTAFGLRQSPSAYISRLRLTSVAFGLSIAHIRRTQPPCSLCARWYCIFSNKEFNFIDLCELPYNMKLITIPYVVTISHHNYGLVFHTVRGFPQWYVPLLRTHPSHPNDASISWSALILMRSTFSLPLYACVGLLDNETLIKASGTHPWYVPPSHIPVAPFWCVQIW